MDNSQEKGELINLMGLWENVDKRGNKYFSGNIGNIKVMIFANSFKQGEREPDYRLYIAKRNMENRQQGQGFTPPPQNNNAGGGANNNSEDDIPF